MAITPRAYYSAYANSVGSVVVVAGDLIVVFGGTNTGTLTVSDNAAGGSNSYVEAEACGPLAAVATGKVWFAVAKASETLTVSVGSPDDGGVSVHVVEGNWDIDTALHLSDQDTDTGTSNTHVSPGLPTTIADAYLFAAHFQEQFATGAHSSNDSFTKRTDHSDHVHTTLDRVVTGTGTYSSSIQGAAVNYGSIIVAFVEHVVDEPEAAITGTGGDGMTEAEVVAGGQTIVITLTDDTFIS